MKTRRSARFEVAGLVLAVLSAMPTGSVDAQAIIGVPVKIDDAFVLQFLEPYTEMVVDAGRNTVSTDPSLVIKIGPDVVVRGKKKKSEEGIAIEAIRPGFQLDLRVERFPPCVAGSRPGQCGVHARSIKIESGLEKKKITIKGYYEDYRPPFARIGGQNVVLKPGSVIKGEKGWKGKVFHSFDEMMLGTEVEVKGFRTTEGVVEAIGGKNWPNDLKADEMAIAAQLDDAIDAALAARASGGSISIGETEIRLARSEKLQNHVSKIGFSLIPDYMKNKHDTDPSKIRFRFFVVDDESFNAFALPNGSVFVNTGLLRVIENDAQLAAVLGHELAHVTHEHSRRRRTGWGRRIWRAAAKGAADAARAATGKRGKAIAVGVTGLLAYKATKYDRDEERQADRVGLYYMHQLGLDPREAPKVWRRVAERVGQTTSALQSIWSSHPAAVERLRNLNREIAWNYYSTSNERPLAERRQAIQRYRKNVLQELPPKDD